MNYNTDTEAMTLDYNCYTLHFAEHGLFKATVVNFHSASTSFLRLKILQTSYKSDALYLPFFSGLSSALLV